MTIENIIKTFNDFIKTTRLMNNLEAKGHVVIKKSITPDDRFKAYKNFKYTLYYIKKKTPIEIGEVSIIQRALTGQEDTVLESLNSVMLKNIFNIINNKEYFDKILKEEI